MKTRNIWISFFLSLVIVSANAQNIGINSTGATPAASAMLDISASDKGLLVPRVALTATNQASPITSPATSLLVYNTATAGSSPNNVIPGYYYWNGTTWSIILSSGSAVNSTWSLAGNSGTTAATNFVGTTDAVDLVVKTNNAERTRITSAGDVGIATTTPQAKLDVAGTYKLGTAGTVLNGLIKTTVSINDVTKFDFSSTRQVTVTLTGATTNATVIVNPRTSLPTSIGIAWCRISAANTLIIAFTNTDATTKAVGAVVFDVTLIQ